MAVNASNSNKSKNTTSQSVSRSNSTLNSPGVFFGASNRLMYDNCSYSKQLYESTSPLLYHLYEGANENCGKCVYDKFWRPFDLVDIESELKNITRPNSHCDQFKYDPRCNKSESCISTFDKDVPVTFVPEVCPIIHNNIAKMTDPGYSLPEARICNDPAGMQPDSANKYLQAGGNKRK
jgi:hypothetical protein